jgi:thiamine biosynthesis lipoprotein ApbE
VIAGDAATADVAATVIGVEPPDVALARADELGVACLLVEASGGLLANDAWSAVAR